MNWESFGWGFLAAILVIGIGAFLNALCERP